MNSRTLNSPSAHTTARHLLKSDTAFAACRIRFPFRPAHLVLAALFCLVLAGTPPAWAQSLTFSTFYSFSQAAGAAPHAALIQAADGAFYGTNIEGGAYNEGVVFRITPGGAFTVIHSFSAFTDPISNADGAWPIGALIQAADGAFYGVCNTGGTYGNGTIFKVTPAGAFTTLYSFSTMTSNGFNTDGANPNASLVQANDGNFYGTCYYGGAYGYGTIFKMTPSGAFTTLYNFFGADGAHPAAALIQAADGALYSTCLIGGTYGFGTVFKITTGGKLTTLHHFGDPNLMPDGADPQSALVQGADGAFYGTTTDGGEGYGTVYQITSGGAFTVLHSFTGSDGANPDATLTLAADGNFYSVCDSGGTYNLGTIFQITPGGILTVLYSFPGGAAGVFPISTLIQAADGAFYGTCPSGGVNGRGSIYRLGANVNPPPSLSSLNPASAAAGGPDFTLTLNGGAFLSGAVANWNGAPLTTTFVSAAQLTAVVPAADIAGVGSANITVTNPDGSGSNSLSFAITGSAPVLSSISPTSVNAGRPTLTLSLKGKNFITTSGVNWTAGGVTTALTTTYVSAAKLTAVVPASLLANPGAAGITVVTPGAGASNFRTLTINLTTIKFTHAVLSRDPTNATFVVADLTLSNTGFQDAPNVTVNQSYLVNAYGQTLTKLPINVGVIPAGKSVHLSLTYPGSSSGLKTHLYVSGTFTGGAFSNSLTVTLP